MSTTCCAKNCEKDEATGRKVRWLAEGVRRSSKEKVEVARRRWGNLRALTKVAGIMGASVGSAKKHDGDSESDVDLF